MATVIDRPATDTDFQKFMQGLTATKPVDETSDPQMYAVVLHNDNSTMFNYVVQVLVEAFKMGYNQATSVMMAAHGSSKCVVCVLPKDVAETRLEAANAMIRTAVPDQDWATTRSPVCQLTFTVEPEKE